MKEMTSPTRFLLPVPDSSTSGYVSLWSFGIPESLPGDGEVHQRKSEYENASISIVPPKPSPEFPRRVQSSPPLINRTYHQSLDDDKNAAALAMAVVARKKQQQQQDDDQTDKRRRIKRKEAKSCAKKHQKLQDEFKSYIKEEDIRDKDILLGRGGKSNHHEGNKIYRVFVWDAQEEYKTLCEYTQKKEKRDISRNIVLKLQQHGCRFLQKEAAGKGQQSNVNLWYEVTDKVAFDKVSQALRDPTPEEKREKKRKAAEAKKREREEGCDTTQKRTKKIKMTVEHV